MLIWLTLVGGIVTIVLGSLAMTRVDEHWRSAHLQCCRCLRTWHSRAKICDRCGGRGNGYDWLAVRFAGFPTHDWQGYLDTGPIPVVPVPEVRFPAVEAPAVEVPAPRAEQPQPSLQDQST